MSKYVLFYENRDGVSRKEETDDYTALVDMARILEKNKTEYQAFQSIDDSGKVFDLDNFVYE